MYYDDIVAISTPPGEGGIAIIRLSGSDVISKVDSIFRPYKLNVDIKEKPSFTLTLGWIIDESSDIIDEVLVSIMRGPNSYTGEDVIEINCHGGTLPAKRCLEEVLKTGARIAEPGEFTKRAFLNGRLDVSQAEAVIEIIRSKTNKGLKLAVKQLTGKNSELINRLEDQLIELNAMVEASLDFPDDVGDLDISAASEIISKAIEQIDKLLVAAKRAEIYRDGIKVVICGKPNVGKSSLLNVLLRKDRAIVTNIPGTTRDVIEDYINIRGIPVKLMDTAGIRLTDDFVEKIGVERSREVIEEADLVVFVLDVETGITEEDLAIFQDIENSNVIILVNKEDLEEKRISDLDLQGDLAKFHIIRGSIKDEVGLDELETTMENMILSGEVESDEMELMINLRQKNSLLQAKKHLEDTLGSIDILPLDCISIDVWGALEALGEITGKNLKEDVLERIFSNFCIGK
ncbi:MAG TPA: tRNA uridine-5-carboxymethylaminomethyl(34) synthesis GTPase MnmE [Syntrophomonadaceae bacterium]|nr:tRNA uridine-5-carboxymethylaminomethyl(34) synthesis GTPase MnmE [Syntrophomonadaceae bacterium]